MKNSENDYIKEREHANIIKGIIKSDDIQTQPVGTSARLNESKLAKIVPIVDMEIKSIEISNDNKEEFNNADAEIARKNLKA